MMSPIIIDLLNQKVEQFNQPDFIEFDPISIPHLFSKKQDIEISGFFAATFAWGQRKTIIQKSKELLAMMDNAPHDFVLNHQENDLKKFLNFKHRTFNATDTLYFIEFFKDFYAKHDSLENAFLVGINENSANIGEGLINFQKIFCGLEDFPTRTRKHIASPASNSTCKRINMFLRWMVRIDNKGVDFGLWENIKPAQLVCPCDVHVERTARRLGLITSPILNWKTALELTENLKSLDATDPVKYDFALFGLGIEGYFD